MREIALDTETTGISHAEGHRIIEIGAVEMINHFRTGRAYHIYINPGIKVSEGAFKVHGISDQFLADKPKFTEIAQDFLDFIGDSKLVIHNAPFDMGFINHHLRGVCLPEIAHTEARVFDTLVFARKKFPGAKNNLDALCARLGVDASKREKHGALLDAELLADVYAEMIGAGANQKNLLFAGATQTTNTAEVVTTTYKVEKIFREPRPFLATNEEIDAHAEFLKSLKNPLWLEAAE